MTMSLIWSFVVACALLPTVRAQDKMQDSRSTPPENAPTNGKLYITRRPDRVPHSMNELCAKSSLIVEGTVTAILPAREMGPRALETDAVIDVATTLKGSSVKQVATSQAGGTKDGSAVTPAGYAMLQRGDHYILFLKPDNRTTVPQIAGITRYLVTGIWSGLFYFEGNRMALTGSESDPLRSKYVGSTLQQVLDLVKTTLAAQ